MKTLSEEKEERFERDLSNPYPPFPKEVLLDLTSDCNCQCFFCGNQKKDKAAYMDKELAFRLMKEAKENGATDIALYVTGEPFLHRDLAEITYTGKKIGIDYIFISTNGSLAAPERAKPVLDAGMDSIKFSINAGTRESYLRVHGRDYFEKVISNVKWFAEYRQKSGLRYRIYVSMVKSSRAKNEWVVLENTLSEYIDEFDARECSNQGGNMLENNDTESISKENLLGSLKEHQFCGRCPDIFSRMSVTPEGFVTACVVDYKKYLIVGDANESSLDQIWCGDAYVYLRKKHIADELKGLICHNCLNNANDECRPLTDSWPKKKTILRTDRG